MSVICATFRVASVTFLQLAVLLLGRPVPRTSPTTPAPPPTSYIGTFGTRLKFVNMEVFNPFFERPLYSQNSKRGR